MAWILQVGGEWNAEVGDCPFSKQRVRNFCLLCSAGDPTFEPRALPMPGTLSTHELQIQPQVILLNVSAGSFLHSKFKSLELPVIQFGVEEKSPIKKK